LGKVLSSESDFLKLKYQRRNKLKAISEKSLGLGKTEKYQNIIENNLGRKKLNKRKKTHKENVRTIVFKAAHSVLDKASKVVSEDLSSPIKSKAKRSKDQKRRLSGWVKGLLASALVSASQRRCASLILVNAAYTSQIDSSNGSLTGIRKGDLFYREKQS
jgi:IS605 OrfB family transposase